MVSSRRKRSSGPRLTSDLSTSRARRSTIRRRAIAPPAQTSSAASSVKPPANTDSRRKSTRSSPVSRSWLHSIVARSVCWRVRAVRLPAASTSRLSPRRAAIWSSDSAATRAAASSMASGMPSRRRQISSMVASSSPFAAEAAGRRRRARRTAGSASASDGHAPGDLALAVQRLAAGGQHAHAGPGAQQVLGQARARVDHVLAVVEHDDRLARGQVRGERLLRRALRGDRHADGQRGRLRHQRAVG